MLSGTGSNRGTKCIPRLARFNPRLALIGFLGTRARATDSWTGGSQSDFMWKGWGSFSSPWKIYFSRIRLANWLKFVLTIHRLRSSWSSIYNVIFVDSFLSSRWLCFLVRCLPSIPISFLTVFLRDLYCSSLQSLFFNRSACLWWYFTSASTRACSAFFLIEPISFLNHRLRSSSGIDMFEMCSRCVNSLCCSNDSSDKFFDSFLRHV